MKVTGGQYSPEANLCGSCGPGVSDLVRSLRDLVGDSVMRAFSQDCFVELVLSVLGFTLDSCFFWTIRRDGDGDGGLPLSTPKQCFVLLIVFCGFYLTCF